jgi:hypothetical protein
MFSQGVDDELRKIDATPALGSLRFGQRELAVDFDEGLLDIDRAALEVDVGPL